MGRKRRDAPLASPSAREGLRRRSAPYWARLGEHAQIGYRTASGKAGHWLVRLTVPGVKSGRVQASLGVADDVYDADAIEVLSYDQACERARKWVQGTVVSHKEAKVHKPVQTVAQAVHEYSAYLELERKSAVPVSGTAKCHILDHPIATLPLHALTVAIVEQWRNGIAESPRGNRSGKAPRKPKVFKDEEEREEALRKRKSTANRVLNILRAALNRAVRRGADGGANAWRLVGSFRGVDGIRTRFLSIDEQQLLVAACEPGIRELVQAALYTGLRVGSLSRMKVRDVFVQMKSILLPKSKGGSNMNIPITSEAAVFFARITKGRRPESFVFTRPDGIPWEKNHHTRLFTEAVKKAGIDKVVFHELRHTFASTLLMAGVNPVALAKAMGHKDTRMIEKHYGHLLPGWAGQEIDAKAPRLGLEDLAGEPDFNLHPRPVIELDPRLKKKLAAGLIVRDEGVS
jgi:integrase